LGLSLSGKKGKSLIHPSPGTAGFVNSSCVNPKNAFQQQNTLLHWFGLDCWANHWPIMAFINVQLIITEDQTS